MGITLICCWLAAVNLLAFASFGIDKSYARAKKRRIPERDLLKLAFLGGTPGAYFGRRIFRHKTRKASFSNRLHVIAATQLGICVAAACICVNGLS